jgi:hypothetical protein
MRSKYLEFASFIDKRRISSVEGDQSQVKRTHKKKHTLSTLLHLTENPNGLENAMER